MYLFNLISFLLVLLKSSCGILLTSYFEKVGIPLFVDLENHFLKAVWTDDVLNCARTCNTLEGCESFMYKKEGNRNLYYVLRLV